MANRIMVGAGAVLRINGVDCGICTGMSYGMAEPKEEKRGIDYAAPFELAPTTVAVAGNVSCLMLRGSDMLEGFNVTPGINVIPEYKYFTMELVERPTMRVIFRVEHTAIDGQQWQAAPKQMVTGTFSFKGLMGYTDLTLR